MKLFTKITELRAALDQCRQLGQSVGFVPTMGALHEGHLSLVRQAAEENQAVVVSIFVNPTQFNDPRDLERYPRTLDKDTELLAGVRCDYIFAPSVEEVYPEPDTRQFGFGSLENVMEGKFRPGHFNGVAQVVSKLFDMVVPDKAYFGLKDFQQLAVIKSLVVQNKYPVTIIPCAIVREADGLAMSSRNRLLTPEHRQIAPVIYKTLQQAAKLSATKSVEEVKEWVVSEINATGKLEVEYFEIVDDTKLLPVTNWNEPVTKVGCIALYAGKIRLIDNIVFDR
jgi:pantothenate synthetase (EC 6.3.2.1)